MKAAFYETTGAPEVIQYGEVPTPAPKAAAAHRLQEENTLQKAGTLTGKIVVVP